MVKKRAIFLDRDGTLIEDKGYEYKIEKLKLLPGVIEGLKLLQKNYLFFIITNQSGIGKGFYSINDFHTFNDFLLKKLKEHDIIIEKTCFCPHIDNCDCKKPKTKFIEDILSEFEIDLPKSWVIGDHPSDILMGKNSGCNTIFLLTGHGERHLEELKSQNISPTIVAGNFLSAAKMIMKK